LYESGDGRTSFTVYFEEEKYPYVVHDPRSYYLYTRLKKSVDEKTFKRYVPFFFMKSNLKLTHMAFPTSTNSNGQCIKPGLHLKEHISKNPIIFSKKT
jgi:hypothetical protein